ncbi:peroxiredoxin-like family protein [Nocardia cyriacigeorgica]|uniref:AhpC/TSA family protein n=1 Tax=Nocardia cyriacigeorgica TaxID=135487 RepID=A0A4U8VYI2_9NOCA|nr:peroxiredoxin-like family protein [Nocardia cyriacigeorgica]MBF6345469.1 AhpC/TSA family protein [Nocardia cyriacigeorgica]MBF6514442.1 AhpC/TSA family protein [Nocardia cyriacigeorgica]VFA97785.1 Uncharacterised protein [Nocardia cyriacigeorgica]
MANIKSTGDRLPPRTWSTVAGKDLTVPADAPITHIQFRRFAGCPICNLHLHTFISRRAELAEAGIHEVVVFHSTRQQLLEYESELPFDVIPDPDKRLYREFGVESSKWAILAPRVWGTIVRAVARSALRVLRRQSPLPPLNPGGGRYGLPADFVVGSDGRLIGVHYGTHADDQLSIDQVLAMARSAGSTTPPRS